MKKGKRLAVLLVLAALLCSCAVREAVAPSEKGEAATGSPATSSPQETAPSAPPTTAPTPITMAPETTESTEPPTVPTDPDVLQAAEANQSDWSWFDDVVFIGDSVSLKLKNYVTKRRQEDPGFLGGAQFLVSGSLGSGNALQAISDETVHPVYQGSKMRLEDSVPLTGAKKVYLMLGMNDIGLYGVDKALENLETLLKLIKTNAPEVHFYIQTVTPMLQGKELSDLNNTTIRQYDDALQNLCDRLDCTYVDVARVMRDENGFLPLDYCSDPDSMGIHFTDLACQIWIGYLCEDAKLHTAG